jgi:hypothetical protein
MLAGVMSVFLLVVALYASRKMDSLSVYLPGAPK